MPRVLYMPGATTVPRAEGVALFNNIVVRTVQPTSPARYILQATNALHDLCRAVYQRVMAERLRLHHVARCPAPAQYGGAAVAPRRSRHAPAMHCPYAPAIVA